MHGRLVTAPILIALTACATNSLAPSNLYTAHHTVVGVDAGVSTDMTQGHLLVGYDRRFATLAPRSAPSLSINQPNGKSDGQEVMSALSCSHLEIDGILLTRYQERLATGEAAVNFVKNADEAGMRRWGNCESRADAGQGGNQ